ncbi:MAG: putative metalloprotease CJM1_0395 family protein [Pseudomonadota bacterium]
MKKQPYFHNNYYMVASIGSNSTVFANSGLTISNRSGALNSNVSNVNAPQPANSVGGQGVAVSSGQKSQNTQSGTSQSQPPSSTQSRAANGEELTEEEERTVQDLKQRDAEVRAHEQAHATAGGNYASAPSYEYTVGPDGKRYATSGEVQIDTAPVRDNPDATIRKMDIVIRAALAPAEPSSQDLQVARQAQQTRAQAQAELAELRVQEARDNGEGQGVDQSEISGENANNDNTVSDITSASQANAAYQAVQNLQGAQNNEDTAQQLFSILL